MDNKDTTNTTQDKRGAIQITQDSLIPGVIKERHLVAGAGANKGDLVYSNANGGFTNLGIGTAGYGLQSVSGVPAWAIIQGIDGWITDSHTWVYASASTFTIAGVDLTSVFTKGTRLKFTQTTVKYAVVISSSFSTNTTVTIAVNTDFSIANLAITNPFYSYAANPQGYPGTFNFTLSYSSAGGAFTNNPTTNTAKFAIVGNKVEYWLDYTYNATSGGSGYTTIGGFPGTPLFQYSNASIASVTTGFQGNGNLSTGGTLFCYKYDATTLIINSAEYSVHGTYII